MLAFFNFIGIADLNALKTDDHCMGVYYQTLPEESSPGICLLS